MAYGEISYDYIKELDDLKTRLYKYIDELCFYNKSHLRIISDYYTKRLVHPNRVKEFTLIEYGGFYEISTESWKDHKNKGWGKPDMEFKGIEIRYLWKRFKPNGIEQDRHLKND